MFCVIRYGILTVMRNQTYKWNKEYRLKWIGGPIRNKLACAAARLHMVWFDRNISFYRWSNIDFSI